jgi:hypothetical protein
LGDLPLIAIQAAHQGNDQKFGHGLSKKTQFLSCQTGNITLLQSQNDSLLKVSGLLQELQDHIYLLKPQEEEKDDSQNFDKMHPDKIARLVPEIIQDLDQEITKKKRVERIEMKTIQKNHCLIKSSKLDQVGYQDQCTSM